MTALSARQLSTLRALLAGRTVTPDRPGLVEAWLTVGDIWAWLTNKSYHVGRNKEVRRTYRILNHLAAMKHDPGAWAETVERLNNAVLRG